MKRFTKTRQDWGLANFLTVAPALPLLTEAGKKCADYYKTCSNKSCKREEKISSEQEIESLKMAPVDLVLFHETFETEDVSAIEPKEKEKYLDRICLDR